jgi:hypothetical protein
MNIATHVDFLRFSMRYATQHTANGTWKPQDLALTGRIG